MCTYSVATLARSRNETFRIRPILLLPRSLKRRKKHITASKKVIAYYVILLQKMGKRSKQRKNNTKQIQLYTWFHLMSQNNDIVQGVNVLETLWTYKHLKLTGQSSSWVRERLCLGLFESDYPSNLCINKLTMSAYRVPIYTYTPKNPKCQVNRVM